MKLFLFFILAYSLTSCFLFSDFKRQELYFNENGSQKKYSAVVPKGFKRIEKRTDSTGNQETLYHYTGGKTLYFVRMVDTTVRYLPIDYETNLPKSIYNSIFFKGIDSSNQFYWRESRTKSFRLGYSGAEKGEDWKFDSALNYFTLRSVR